MRTKSKYRQQYRQFKDGGRVDLSGQTELPVEPPIDHPTETVSAAPPAPAVDSQPEPPAPQPEQARQDDATLALKKQIDGLRQSAELQRQQAAQAAMPPQAISREQRLEAWRAHGLSDAELQFFQNHPAMLDHPELTNFAVHKAREAGFERGSEGIFATVEKIFNANLAHLQEQAQPAMEPTTPTPNFFRPPPGPPVRSAPNPSSIVSAPVSRNIPSSGSGRRHTPGKVTLTPSEVEAAKIANISLDEYARQKIEYERQREAGEYRDNREQR
jgi:hypothetical protein